MKTKEDLLKYCIRIRERGDGYRDILRYLGRNTEDETVIKSIMATVEKLEADGQLNIKSAEPEPRYWGGIILGIFFIVAGVFMIFAFWDMGYIAVLPFVLIIVGFAGLTGRLDELLKIF